MAAPTKKYGLIKLPKKGEKPAPLTKASIFDDDSDEDPMDAVNKEIILSSQKNKTKRQTQMEIDKAIADDPNVYAYDELYDDMKSEEKKKVEAKMNVTDSSERKSRYIGGLMKAAEKRTKEHERRAEKKVQKEREAEGDEFADKEKFVTSAYKKKMAEMQALDAEEKRKEALEAAMDVTKQADMTGFYRNLYKQEMGTGPDYEVKQEVPSSNLETTIKQEVEFPVPAQLAKNSHKQRNYRQRASESPSREGERQVTATKSSNSKERKRSRSGERKRSRSGDRKRSRSREKKRSRSRDKKISRSSKERKRSRSRGRQHLEGSKGDRKESSRKDSHRHSSRERKQSSHSENETAREVRRMERAETRSRSAKRRSSVSRHSEIGKDENGGDQAAKKEDEVSSKSPTHSTDNKPTASKSAEERFAKRNDSTSIQSAKERYLARKAGRAAV
ncbi:nuclear speckle splicing regulatory protein 1-like [Watersipora subatra]|uniref:nuclear speckle splicing regulatory protein 1-like n=1 Tax=Watersipora subatra TaxID=2589382 RepID=UPI00355B5241